MFVINEQQEEYQEDSVYKIENSWKSLFLTYDFDIYELYFSENNIIYPKMEMLFEVFKEPCNEIKICILKITITQKKEQCLYMKMGKENLYK